jgi:hypothetical protein
MNVIRPEDCPDSLQLTDAIDIAYGSVLGEVIRRLQSGISWEYQSWFRYVPV